MVQNSFSGALIIVVGLLLGKIEGCSEQIQEERRAVSESLLDSPELRLLSFLGKRAGRDETPLNKESPKHVLDDLAAGIHGVSKEQRQKIEVDCVVLSIALTGPIAHQILAKSKGRVEVVSKPSFQPDVFDPLTYWVAIPSDSGESEALVDCLSVLSEGSARRSVKSTLRVRFTGETWIEIKD